jgi:uncharacterized protein YjdB
VSAGSATITVTTQDGNKTATCYVTVTAPTIAVTFYSVTANGSSTQTTTELTLSFIGSITGLSAADITLSGVNGVTKGTLTGSNPYTLPISGFTSGGTLNVSVAKTGFTISGSPKTVEIYYGSITVTGVSLNKTALSLDLGGTETLTATISPSNAANKSVTWKSSAETVVTVSDKGLITGKTTGNATITVTTADGNRTATCAVTVTSTLTPAALASYLATLSTNTIVTPHNITLKVSNAEEFLTIRIALNEAGLKYVKIDLTGSTVTSIEGWAFQDCISLASITIPDNVTSIGYGAFYGCISLVSVTIPNSITSIEFNTFSNCTNLTNITIPNGVTRIEGCAFEYCTSLASITIPDSVTSIGDMAFKDCARLANVNIGNGVTSIEGMAFVNCISLVSVTIPSSVTSIGVMAFYGCISLASVTFSGTILSNMFSFGIVFPDFLREVFYATDPINGTPGTYTRPVGGTVWTRQ